MSHSNITYQRFIRDELTQINKEFNEKGYKVHSPDDVRTYKGWMDEGRKVKKGEKGLKLTSNNKYTQPIFNCGSLVYENGKQVFAKFPKTYVLFHAEQTESVTA
tara:strand:+ start:63 stop:374 length:312 start_codon:yes stop_codon:yes gene_type:complete